MHPIQTQLETTLQEEAVLIQKIGLCQDFIDVLLAYISHSAHAIPILTAEDILTSVHNVAQDLETELLHVRLEKGILDNKLRCQQLQAESINGSSYSGSGEDGQ
ncbi:hypothetical protein ABE504_22575 [Paenibacillus oryzisoli]|uniref:hypothetical protein n=1 Tax=Paenibacillus oryzisoli TaxID=1850517 RepID=UPI003D26A30A